VVTYKSWQQDETGVHPRASSAPLSFGAKSDNSMVLSISSGMAGVLMGVRDSHGGNCSESYLSKVVDFSQQGKENGKSREQDLLLNAQIWFCDLSFWAQDYSAHTNKHAGSKQVVVPNFAISTQYQHFCK
jgi:hypothetical protein